MFVRVKPLNTKKLLLNRTPRHSSHSVAEAHLHNPQSLISLLAQNPSNRNLTRQIHSLIVTSGFFLTQPRSSILFNTLLRSYSHVHFPLDALYLFKHSHSLAPFDCYAYSILLHACSNLDSVSEGSQVHGLTFKAGFEFHVYVQTTLVNLYVLNGSLVDACRVFDEMPARNSVSWNVMISGLAKRGDFELARSLFLEMPHRTVVSWTVIIDALTRKKKFGEAMRLFRRMVDIKPSKVTLLAIIPAISNLGDLKNCRAIHSHGEKRGFNASDIRLANSLVDSYSKCGCIESASRVFSEIGFERRNLVSWSSIISGFAMHGMGDQAVESFERMEKAGLRANRVTFLSALNGFSHGGLVEEGLRFFAKMVDEYGMKPDIKQYGCLVDMLGRTGRLEEAERVAIEIPVEISNVIIWRTLLGACSFHGHVEMGERATRKIMEIEREYGGDYVLMSNIFASVGRYQDSEKFRTLLDLRKAYKSPGHSTVLSDSSEPTRLVQTHSNDLSVV